LNILNSLFKEKLLSLGLKGLKGKNLLQKIILRNLFLWI